MGGVILHAGLWDRGSFVREAGELGRSPNILRKVQGLEEAQEQHGECRVAMQVKQQINFTVDMSYPTSFLAEGT